MASKLVKSLLSAGTLALVGASLFMSLTVRANPLIYNGNYEYDSNGNKIGCGTFQPPYDCNWK